MVLYFKSIFFSQSLPSLFLGFCLPNSTKMTGVSWGDGTFRGWLHVTETKLRTKRNFAPARNFLALHVFFISPHFDYFSFRLDVVSFCPISGQSVTHHLMYAKFKFDFYFSLTFIIETKTCYKLIGHFYLTHHFSLRKIPSTRDFIFPLERIA